MVPRPTFGEFVSAVFPIVTFFVKLLPPILRRSKLHGIYGISQACTHHSSLSIKTRLPEDSKRSRTVHHSSTFAIEHSRMVSISLISWQDFFFSRTFLTQVFCSSCRHYVVRGPENSPYEGIKLMVWMWHWYIKKQCILLCPRLKHPCSASEWCHLLFKILNHWSLNIPRGNSHSKAIRACPAGWGKGFVPCKITNYQSLSLGFN